MRGRNYRLLFVAMLGAVSLALAGAAPASAAVGSMTANLRVFKADFPAGTWWVHVYGSVSMTPAEAQGLINSGHKVMWRLMGDDPVSDDLQLNWRSSPIFVSSQGLGLSYSHAEKVGRAVVNEDDSIFDRRDELFAQVKLVGPTGQTIRSANTNVVVGYF